MLIGLSVQLYELGAIIPILSTDEQLKLKDVHSPRALKKLGEPVWTQTVCALNYGTKLTSELREIVD